MKWNPGQLMHLTPEQERKQAHKKIIKGRCQYLTSDFMGQKCSYTGEHVNENICNDCLGKSRCRNKKCKKSK
jgi:hypothetical protein